MNKILEVETFVYPVYYITTDDDLFPCYRRSSNGSWERSMGESMETVFDDQELESLFQQWLKERSDDKEETEV